MVVWWWWWSCQVAAARRRRRPCDSGGSGDGGDGGGGGGGVEHAIGDGLVITGGGGADGGPSSYRGCGSAITCARVWSAPGTKSRSRLGAASAEEVAEAAPGVAGEATSSTRVLHGSDADDMV